MIVDPRPVFGAPPTDPPVVAVVIAALATRLADAWFLFLLVTVGYWLAPRLGSLIADATPLDARSAGTTDERPRTETTAVETRATAVSARASGATIVGIALAALAVTAGAKAAFAFPRPPGAGTIRIGGPIAPLVASAAEADGFGFPSGHAIAATAVYGGLAGLLDIGRRRTRLVVAGGVIVLVAATRVVLGVHYPADVVAGVAVGTVTLALLLRIGRSGSEPARALAAAGLLGLLAALVALVGGHDGEVLQALTAAGAGVGGAVAWRVAGDEQPSVGVVESLVGLAVVGGAFGYATALTGTASSGLVPATLVGRSVLALLVGSGAVGLLIGWPAVVARFHEG